MKLNRKVGIGERMKTIDFEVPRSKVKVTGIHFVFGHVKLVSTLASLFMNGI